MFLKLKKIEKLIIKSMVWYFGSGGENQSYISDNQLAPQLTTDVVSYQGIVIYGLVKPGITKYE